MKLFKILLLATLSAFLAPAATTLANTPSPHTPNAAPDFIGWFPLQQLEAGRFLKLDMHRFYFSNPFFDGRLNVLGGESKLWKAHWDSEQFLLGIFADKETKGLIEIPIQVIGKKFTSNADMGKINPKGTDADTVFKQEAVIVVAVQPPGGHRFVFSPKEGKTFNKVTVAGDFNGWNSNSHVMVPVEDGSYELNVRLPVGTHSYKFIVDGEWILDPDNPEHSSDNNSIARVAKGSEDISPVVFADKREANALTFTIVPGNSKTTQVSSIVQLPDGNSQLIGHEIKDNSIRIETSGLPSGSWIRVVVADAKGNASNAARAPVKALSGFQWQDGIIYYAFTDRFADGEPSNNKPVKDDRVPPQANYQGGDFQGVRKKIDEGYFQDLGVNVLWLSPLFRNPDGAWESYVEPHRVYTGYHGYWPVSHEEIEPRFGGEEALTELVRAAHGQQMSIIADLVLKHVHTDHPLWKEHPEYFGSLDLPDGTKNLRQWDQHQFTTWFEEWLPGFDFDKPEAIKFLIANAVDTANKFKLDGYRLDAVKHIKTSFWWRYRTAIRSFVDSDRKIPLYNVGETFMDREGIMSFVGPNMLDGQFDFPLYDTLIDVFAKGKAGMEQMEKSLLESESIYGKETLMSPLVGNHDKGRFMAYADGDLPDPKINDEEEVGWEKPPKVDNPAAYEKLKLAFTFILSIDGVPMIYYGDEIGMSGAGDPDNRRMMRWGQNVTKDEESVREHVSKVAAIRHAHPALRYGSRRPLVAEGNRLAFVRAHLGDSVLAVWNNGENQTLYNLTVAPEMSDGVYVDPLSKEEIEVKDGKTSFKLPSMKSALFVAKE